MTAGGEPTPFDLARFRELVRGRLGLEISLEDQRQRSMLSALLRRRLAETGREAEAYLDELEIGGGRWPAELGALARELTVGETYFFRNIDQFHALRQLVLPERAEARGPGGTIRMLSAGCASGDEPYTLAMIAREVPALAACEITIRAVDVNPAVLERAVAGRYAPWALRETPADARARYFRPDGRQLVLDPEIRGAVAFEARNLVEPNPTLWEPGSFDVIFCRNVLMYFTATAMRAVVARIASSLAPGGYLFLGHAETLRGVSPEFHLCHTHGTFYYQRRPVDETAGRAEREAGSWMDDIHRAADRIRALTGRSSGGVESAFLTSEVPATTSIASPAAATAIEPAADQALAPALELLHQERFAEARAALAALPGEIARHPDALLLRAVLHTHGGDLGAAERLCGDLLARDEMNAGAHYLTALCRERLGDGVGAARHDQIAVYLDPAFAMPRLHLGLIARRAGDRWTARRELADALALLERELPARLSLFGGGFGRQGLLALCRAELDACGGSP